LIQASDAENLYSLKKEMFTSSSSRTPSPRSGHSEWTSLAFVTVLWTTSWVEAEIAKGRLEAEGIPVDLRGEGGEGPYRVGPAELLVPSKFESQARRFLEQADRGSDGPWTNGRTDNGWGLPAPVVRPGAHRCGRAVERDRRLDPGLDRQPHAATLIDRFSALSCPMGSAEAADRSFVASRVVAMWSSPHRLVRS
jgi:Putative prokaryotic signal transducing protein